jgi:hypothetical protein
MVRMSVKIKILEGHIHTYIVFVIHLKTAKEILASVFYSFSLFY